LMRKIISLVTVLAALAATPAFAAAESYTYDPLHTQVLFSINHMGYTSVHGRFDKFSGSFTLDEQHPENSAATFTIDANSIDLGDNTWNEHTKEKFLEPAKF